MTDPTTPTSERWLTPGVRGIGAASLLADVGHEIPTALLPNLLTATLGAPAAAATVWQVGVLRAGAWAARGLRVPARNPLLADIAPATVYGRAYGVERAMDNLGAIAGQDAAIGLCGDPRRARVLHAPPPRRLRSRTRNHLRRRRRASRWVAVVAARGDRRSRRPARRRDGTCRAGPS